MQTELKLAEIRDEFGDVESVALVETTAEADVFYREHGLSLMQTTLTEFGWTLTRLEEGANDEHRD